jgi:hypothetical protein
MRRAGILVAVVLAACEPPTDPIEKPDRRLVIHAILDANTSSQEVMVEHLDGAFGHRLVRVGGAEVTITTPDGEVFTAIEIDNDEVGLQYRLLGLGHPTPLVPGGTYTLRVRTALGEEATGTTTLPEFTQSTHEVVQTLERSRDTVSLSWNRVPLAKRYEIYIEAVLVFEDRQFFQRTYRAFTDTSITIAGTARTLDNDAVFIPGSSALVHVAAVDDNYYTYYHTSVDPFAGAPPSRLTGALGVFGSIAPVRTRTYQDVR